MAVFWVFTAAYALAAKYLLSFMNEWHLILWSSLGSMLKCLLLLDVSRLENICHFRSGLFCHISWPTRFSTSWVVGPSSCLWFGP
jgi:hypothetical protein